MTEKKLAEAVEDYLSKRYFNGIFEPDDAAIEIASMAIEHFRTIHSRALACHCECLGMNAENSYRVCRDKAPAYGDEHYDRVLQKWGLMNEKGEPLI